ncbi:MAG: hypothetical protein Q9191_004931 [Dirinaria sp. TL-2023a]
MFMWRYLFYLTVLLTSALGSSNALFKGSYWGNTGYGSLESRTNKPYEGIGVVKGSCPGNDLATARKALTEAYSLAQAGLAATVNFTQPPFSTFFPPDKDVSQIVASVYRRTLQNLSGTGGQIGVLCHDIYKKCTINSTQMPLSGPPAYSIQPLGPTRLPLIVLCPIALNLAPTPDPCTRAPGGIYLGWVVLESMVKLRRISGPGLTMRGNPNNITAASVIAAVQAGQDTVTNPIAYAHLGTWAQELGVGVSLGSHQRPCLQQYRNYDTSDVVGNQPT